MSIRTAFVFPGQGSQKVGMGRAWADAFPAARAAFDEASAALGFDLARLCWEGPEEELQLTANTQPAILTVSAAIARVLAERGVRFAAAAGHSLGEYSAHVAAGTLALADAVGLVRERGQRMQEAVPVGVGAMAAILGLAPEAVGEVVAEAAGGEVCSVANYNSPEQTVIAGHRAAVERAMALARQRGAKRALPLPVSAPFHCALMAPAREGLAPRLAATRFADPAVPVVVNVDAVAVTTGAAARDALVRQIDGPVRWVESVRALHDQLGVVRFVEVGPGAVLAGLVRRIVPEAEAFSLSERVRRTRRPGIDPSGSEVTMFRLDGRTALVTGASQGIGEAIARRLAAQGARVVLAARNQEKLEALAASIAADGGAARPLVLDLANAGEVGERLKALPADWAEIEILVNNAGITADGLLARMSLEQWQSVIDTNLTGSFAVTRELVRGMMRRRWGRIVTVSSVVGLMGNAGQANYAAAKAGLIGFTKSVARELASRNVTANVVAPGFVETAMTEVLPEETKKRMFEDIPLGRFGRAEEIAAAVVYLASDEAGYVTGQVLNVSGGLYI